MSILKKDDCFYLETKNTSYVIKIQNKFPIHLYYGNKINNKDDLSFLIDVQKYGFIPCEKDNGFGNLIPQSSLLEYSGNNTGDFRTSSIEIVDSAGKMGCRLLYKEYKIIKGAVEIPNLPCARFNDNTQTLILTLCDEIKNVQVDLIYTIYDEEDVIVRSAVIKNKGQDEIIINKAMSLTLDFNKTFNNLYELGGDMNCEHTLMKSCLRQGITTISSSYGFSSHTSNPFFMICDNDSNENSGEVYGFNLSYSSSFLCENQQTELSKTRVSMGISPKLFSWTLNGGESFYTPQAIFTCSNKGFNGISYNFHKFIRDYVLPEKWAFSHRPSVINTWEFSGFDVNEEKIFELSDKAKELNIEMIVLDDGWFRNNDKENLGDWDYSKEKFPHGLKYVSERVREKGLKFGIWFEPEMVSDNSNLYKEHPNWILSNGDENFYGRNQLVLDFSNCEVVDYIFNKIDKIITECKADYIKIDANRYISEVGNNIFKNQGEILHRRMLGMYCFLGRLTDKYPDMLVETCAGGGGRFDLGMLHYSPQIWLSDNTDPISRLEMHWGISYAYPPSTISCHISKGTWLNGFNTSMEFRYMVASFGTLGYEFNLETINENERKKVVEFNKRQLINEEFALKGRLYRICDNEFYQSYIEFDSTGKKSLLTLLIKRASTAKEFILLKLYGFDENAYYKNNQNDLVLSGKTLNSAGIIVNNINSDFKNDKKKSFNSMVKKSAGGVQILFEIT